MIRWFDNLYLDEAAARHPKAYRRRVESERRLKRHCNVIALASNEDNLFDIFDTKELYFRYNRSRDIYVVGLAATYEDAVELLSKMVLEIIQEENSFTPRKYFSKERFK